MVALRRMALWAMLVTFGLGALPPRASAHPLHTTLTELTTLPDGSLQIVMRLFLDDFSAAVTRRTPAAGAPIPMPPDSATARYLGGTVLLTDVAGRRVPLVVTGMRRTDDLVWITLRTSTARPAAGARLSMRVLFDRWDDQVNIVQSNIAARRQTLLFTTRDGGTAKSL